MRLQKNNLIGIVFIFAICLAFSCGSFTSAVGWEIETLQKEINARGYKWKAGETSLSDLSPEEFKSMLGAKLPEKIQMMPAKVKYALPYGLPTSLDWRNYNGGNWITPVKNQRQCGSCYSFGTLGTMETLIKLSQSNPSFPIDLSEQYVVSCGPYGNRSGYDYGGCEGNYMDYVCDFLVSTGTPDELCFPYDSTQQLGTEPPCGDACTDVASRVEKVSNYSFIAGDIGYITLNPDNIKAVVENKPVPCGMVCYNDFSNYIGGIYQPVPELGEDGGGHIVYIIGYDDSQSCWIVKNSWGTDWGETASFTPYTPGAGNGGYFRVDYVTSSSTLTWFGLDAVDLNYTGGPTSTTTTAGPSTSTTTTTTNPSFNLKPYTPSGWDGPIVPSSVMGTNVVNTLCGRKPTFIDIAAINEGPDDIAETFYIDLYIDEEIVAWWYSEGLPYGYIAYVEDWEADPVIVPGQHTLKIVVDSEDDVTESNENDNEYEETFTWKAMCPWTSTLYEGILGENSQERLSSLRNFRDDVLLFNQTGKEYVDLLYDHSEEIASLLSENPALRLHTAKVIVNMMPEVRAALNGEEMVISQELINEIEPLLGEFAVKASPDLKVTIEKVKRDIKRRGMFRQLEIAVE